MKQEYLQVRISEDEKAELNELISKMPNRDITISQFVRDAIREKVATIKQSLEAETAGVNA